MCAAKGVGSGLYYGKRMEKDSSDFFSMDS